MALALSEPAFASAPSPLETVPAANVGGEARLIAWRALLRRAEKLSEYEQVVEVNDFFNAFKFESDRAVWGRDDRWTTPAEFIAQGRGDCEDFAIAKFFTLARLGVPESRLRLVYTRIAGEDGGARAHMVVHYDRMGDPLVLDNVATEILPAPARTDLQDILSFNRAGLWTAGTAGRRLDGAPGVRIRRWGDVLAKIEGSQAPKKIVQATLRRPSS